MIQIILHCLYVAICEFIELAILNRRTEQLSYTIVEIKRRLPLALDDQRWN